MVTLFWKYFDDRQDENIAIASGSTAGLFNAVYRQKTSKETSSLLFYGTSIFAAYRFLFAYRVFSPYDSQQEFL